MLDSFNTFAPSDGVNLTDEQQQSDAYLMTDGYQISEFRKEIDYLLEEVVKLKRLVKNMKDLNRLKLLSDDEEYLRMLD